MVTLTPRFETGAPLLLVGLVEQRSSATAAAIPAQWQRFMARHGEIADKTQPIPVGITLDMRADGSFYYGCMVEVSEASALPQGLRAVSVPAQSYAVFRHTAHVSMIGATYDAIEREWLPASGRRRSSGPSLERHLETFDPGTGLGGIDIWIPLA